MRNFGILLMILVFTFGASAQKDQKSKENEKTATADAKSPNPFELAKKSLAAHGGDKLKNIKNIFIKGTADISASPSQTLPAGFLIVYEGEKYSFDIQAPPMFNFKQTFDGQETFSSMRGMSLPPLNRLGFPMLVKMEEKGYTVSALPEKFKKKNGFRITSADGFYTDFIVDEKTNLVQEYESSYEFNGGQVTTSVAIDKYKEVGGVLINEKFSQRLEMGTINYYSSFKAKEILVDTKLPETTFSIPK
ncbi:MAG TPA: hypothetical protein VIL74_22055 [Pyrinomonadaceae bacterium]|jgi:hypothetical protein